MRTAYIIGYLAGVAIQARRSVATERTRLRAENVALARDVDRLAKIADNLRIELTRAESTDLADLDATETFQDFLWLTGGE